MAGGLDQMVFEGPFQPRLLKTPPSSHFVFSVCLADFFLLNKSEHSAITDLHCGGVHDLPVPLFRKGTRGSAQRPMAVVPIFPIVSQSKMQAMALGSAD